MVFVPVGAAPRYMPAVRRTAYVHIIYPRALMSIWRGWAGKVPYGDLKLANDPLPSMLYILISMTLWWFNCFFPRDVHRVGAGIPRRVNYLPHIHTHFPILRVLVKGLKPTNSFFLKFFASPAQYIRGDLAPQETFRIFTG